MTSNLKNNLIDGKKQAQQIRVNLKQYLKDNPKKIGLAVVLVGDDPASQIYVKNKVAACQDVGILSFVHHLPQNCTQAKLLDLIDILNLDCNVHGILVQLPLPKHIDSCIVIDRICHQKDVDGLTNYHIAKLAKGQECIVPCTPSGIVHLINSTGTSIEGKHAVVVGRSQIVGRPIAQLLLNYNATLSVCHSSTLNLAMLTKQADILIVAVGQRNLINKSHVKLGAIVIDVGINRFEGRVCGDVNFEEVSKVAGFITPVPGGVGPMTIASLLQNVIKCKYFMDTNVQ
ncbi:MAG: bifunctional 5,10-methylene-tetrahydrofolate dehydrogenase/5,10-methylene-tetrahydrofolate cyclohydrolase [Clostridiales bacterium]|nr:bifunctional 5,10-methylene-tetrahydrofolate dehydrogenase/5,10-methylene-tetrahydrofolate cyclohydrolase [Clostridiales bacterium]